MQATTVLISGGGIAGLTLAYWLERRGFRPTIVEQSPHLRTEGYAIDFAGSGWDVAERMHLIAELCRRQNQVGFFIFKDAHGRAIARMAVENLRRSFHGKLIQIMRQDLEQVLYEAICDTVEIRFGTTIQRIEQSPGGAFVSLSDGTAEHFDLVVGADGIHSHVRRLVFGDERQFAVYLGYYFATFPVPNLDRFEDGANIYMEPNRQATVYPNPHGGSMALLAYRAQDAGHIAAAQRKRMLEQYYQGAG